MHLPVQRGDEHRARARRRRPARRPRRAAIPGPRREGGVVARGAGRRPPGVGRASAGPTAAGSEVRSAAPRVGRPGHGQLGREAERVTVDPRRHEQGHEQHRRDHCSGVRGSTCIEHLRGRTSAGRHQLVRYARSSLAGSADGDPSRATRVTSTRSARWRPAAFATGRARCRADGGTPRRRAARGSRRHGSQSSRWSRSTTPVEVIGHVVCSRAWVGEERHPVLGLGPIGVPPRPPRRRRSAPRWCEPPSAVAEPSPQPALAAVVPAVRVVGCRVTAIFWCCGRRSRTRARSCASVRMSFAPRVRTRLRSTPPAGGEARRIRGCPVTGRHRRGWT